MPTGKPLKTFRANSAAYQWKLLDLLDDDKVKYAVGGHLDAATVEAGGTIPAKAWQPYNDGFVAETVHIMNKMNTSFRLVRNQTAHPQTVIPGPGRNGANLSGLTWFRAPSFFHSLRGGFADLS